MHGKSGYIYSDKSIELLQIASKCDLKISQTIEDQKKFTSLEAQITDNASMIQLMNTCLGRIKPWIKDLRNYNAQKRKDALYNINSALAVAKAVVPAAMTDVTLKMVENEAWLETSGGLLVDKAEGSGYKGVVSPYLRAIVLRACHQFMQFMILDEPLAKLSPESSATLSTYMPLLVSDMQVIWIEQKPEAFIGIQDKTVYQFFKDDIHGTIVTKLEDV